ncbi:unnamed protein product, partial [Coregonus sp. 'balchen']
EPAQYDPTFNGPIRKRGCTDIICCILFIVVILGYMAVGILAWLYGDPRHVLYPRNSTGMFCGIGVNEAQPSVFYFDILKCATSINIMAASLNGLQCPTTQKVKEIVDQELCPFFYTPTVSVLGRCIPDVTALKNIPNTDIVNSFNAKEIGVRIFEDFASSWQWIIAALVIAMVVSFLFLLLLRFIAPVMVWVLIFGVLAVGAYGIYHCWWEYNNYRKSTVSITDIGFSTDFKVYLQVKETWLTFLIILSVVEGILLLTLIFLRTRILIAIALIQESSKAVSHMMSTLFYPLITFVLLVVCVAYWGITALYLATSGIPVYKVVALNSTQDNCGQISGNETCDPQTFYNSTDYSWCPSARCIFIKYNNEGLLQRNLFNLQLYNVVAFLWCVNFVIAMGQCTLAGAFASYYWAFSKPSDIPTFPLSQAFIRTLRYHVGSLAFGALILTLIQIVRIILEYLDHKTRVLLLVSGEVHQIAVYGKNFCVSAKNAFMLLMRNIVRVVVLDKVTDLLLFFGKLLVVGGVGVLAFFFFSGRIRLPGSNFLEDLERHDGTMQKPYYMSKNLMKILNKKNKGPKKDKGKD